MLQSKSYRPARYLVVGTVCAVANNLILIVGDLLGGHYLALLAIAFLIVTPTAYWLHTAFTFGAGRSLRSLFLFSAGAAAGFPLSVLVTALLFSGLGAPMIVTAPVATVLLLCWNYCASHWSILNGARRRLTLSSAPRR